MNSPIPDPMLFGDRVSRALADWREADRSARESIAGTQDAGSLTSASDLLRSFYQGVVEEARAWHNLVVPGARGPGPDPG